MKISAQMLVKNEEAWVWFAIMSVIDYVDEIIVWDSGSTDKTVEILKTIPNTKIKFRQVDQVDEKSFTKTRQSMLEEAKPDWILIVDGDEIWPEEAIFQTISTIKTNGSKFEYLVNKSLNLVGDVYHYQDPLASHYHIGNYYGSYTIRAVNIARLPGIHFEKPYGSEGLFDSTSTPVQNRRPTKSALITAPYLHTTHLRRSSQDESVMRRSRKFKHELGMSMSKEFVYPKCFYISRPQLVSSPWKRRNSRFTLNALWQSPLKYIYRRIK